MQLSRTRTLIEILKLTTDFLQQRGIEHPRRQAEELLCDALDLKRMQIYMEHDRPLLDAELERVRSYLTRRGKGEPLAYIHGSVQFYGCSLKITPAVLIPRQETELLVDLAAKELELLPRTGKILWDLCCGSGCIGIALKKRFPELRVVLSDFSSEALAIARENATHNQVDVEIIQGNFEQALNHPIDYLVCNPPYVTEQEYARLEGSVRLFEPKMALVGGAKGTEFYQRLSDNLNKILNKPGRLWLEIGETQGEEVQKIFGLSSEVTRDFAGKSRFFSLEFV